MKILIVEDQPDKKESIVNFVRENFSNVNIEDRSSLRGALKEIVTNPHYDLILLDMSMPNFDPTDIAYDDSPESYAGKELMEQMDLRDISIPVIIITQYSSFEGGSVGLDKLSLNFSELYSKFYLGYVYYNSANDSWKSELINTMKKLK